MARNKRAKNRGPGTAKTRKSRWVVVSGDASLRYGEVLSTHRSEDEARQASLRILFATHRRENEAERRARLAKNAEMKEQ